MSKTSDKALASWVTSPAQLAAYAVSKQNLYESREEDVNSAQANVGAEEDLVILRT